MKTFDSICNGIYIEAYTLIGEIESIEDESYDLRKIIMCMINLGYWKRNSRLIVKSNHLNAFFPIKMKS